jgi:hypothetical protein
MLRRCCAIKPFDQRTANHHGIGETSNGFRALRVFHAEAHGHR